MDFYLHESTVQQYFTLYLLSTARGLHTGLHSKSKPTIIFISEGRGSTLKKKKKIDRPWPYLWFNMNTVVHRTAQRIDRSNNFSLAANSAAAAAEPGRPACLA